MQGPCFDTESAPVWFFVLFAVLSHARGTVLLLREVLSWLRRRRNGGGVGRTPYS